jgi:serine/threonine protein kinase/tetratricopeptide (TPR) repeat protein
MAPERWPEVKEILAAALEMEPALREGYLERACAGKPDIRQEVESLIASFEDAGDFIERPALEPGEASQAIGRRIGAYRIEELIGHGGMGSVYRAIRVDSEFRQQVAIKLVKPGMDTSFVLRRFRNERQILASLDHPHIARLLDGGTTDDGLPYFVMEHIQGKPIDQYCDEKKLPTSERLKLFRDVCSAVHYAHEKMVIHRDIKPANILITADGSPKLLDFGIAKILDPDLATSALDPTATVLRLMTPEYASPEQVRGEPITAASDVYSLGVLLYELLTGHRPYRLRSRSAYEIVQVICEGTPDRPSSAVTKTVEVTRGSGTVTLTPEAVSETREGEPAKLRRRLAGDLDNIAMKAIRKEPHRRYASAAELSEDIRRHLEGAPVQARGDTVTYNAFRFVRRHRTAMVAGFVAAICVAASMAFFHYQTAMRAPEAALAPARQSVAVLGFRNLSGDGNWAWLSGALTEMLVSELAAGEKLRAVSGESIDEVRSAVLESGGNSLAGRSLLRVRSAIGADYIVSGSYLALGPKGHATVRLDIRLQRASNGESVATVTDSAPEADLLKLIARAGTDLRGRLGMAVERSKESLPANIIAARFYSEGLAHLRVFDTVGARDLLSQALKEDPRHALSHSAIAMAWTSLGNDAKAAEHARTAYELAGGLSREETLFLEGRYYETVRAWAKATQIYRQLWTSFPDTADYGIRLASTLAPMGQGKEALQLLETLRRMPSLGPYDPRIDLTEAEAALAISEFERAREVASRVVARTSEEKAPTLVARAKLLEARAYSELGDFVKSVETARHSQRLYEQDKHQRGVSQALNVIGYGLAARGDLKGARDAYERSAVIAREIGSKGGIAFALDNLVEVVRREGDLEHARRLQEEALEIRRQNGSKSGLANSLANMAGVLHDQGKLDEARRYGEEALALRHELKQRRGVGLAMNLLAPIFRKQGELAAAETMSRESATLLDEVGDRRSAIHARLNLGQALCDLDRKAEARQIFERVVAEAQSGGYRSLAASALFGLGKVAMHEHRLEEARKHLEEAFRIHNELGERSRTSLTRLALAELTIAEGRPGAGELLAKQALEEFRREKATDREAWAFAVLSQTLLAEGKTGEARRAAARAMALLGDVEQREVLLAAEKANQMARAAR